MMHARRSTFIGRLLFAGGMLALAIGATATWAADSPVGEWALLTDAGGQESKATLIISEAGGELSASMVGEQGELEVADPSFEDGVLKFSVTIDAQGQELVLDFEGKIDGDSMDGTWISEFGDFPVTGTRGGGASPVGVWTLVTDAGGQESVATLTITEANGTLSGSIDSDQGEGPTDLTNPTFEGGVLKFEITFDAQGQEMTLEFEGTIDGDSMDGTWISDFGDFPSTGTRGGSASSASASPAGVWTLVTDAGGQESEATLTIAETNGSISGSIQSDLGEQAMVNPTFEDGVLAFEITIDAQGQEMTLEFEGTIDGDSMDGTWITDFGDFPATGTRAGSASTAAASPAGVWTIMTDANGQESEATLTITDANGSLSGSLSSEFGEQDIENAASKDGVLTFEVTIDAEGQELALEFEGKIDGDSIEGVWGSDMGDFPFTGTRAGGDAPSGDTPAIVGTWTLEVDTDMGVMDRKLVVNKDLTGTYGGDELGEFAISNVQIDGNEVEFDVTLEVQGTELPSHVTLTIDGNSIEGALDYGQGEASITGKK